MHVQLCVSIVAIIVVRDVNGLPSGTPEKNKPQNLRNILKAHPFLRGTQIVNPKKQSKLTFKRADLLEACKGKKGPKRKTCVTSFARRMYPEYFNIDQTDKVPGVNTLTTSNPACQNLDQTTTTTVKPNNLQSENYLRAVLVASGIPKSITAITQENQNMVAIDNIQTDTPIPPNCRAEYLGYEPEISGMMTDMSFDMLCALAQYQGDQQSIYRYCLNDGQELTA